MSLKSIQIGNIIDITGELANQMWGYHILPGSENLVPPVEISSIATVDKNGFFSSKITLSTISGTYLEAGSHVLLHGNNIDEYPVDRFVIPAKVIKLPRQIPRALINAELLQKYSPQINPGDALLIGTGWDENWNDPGYVLDSPNMNREAMEWIISNRISLLGVDITCIVSPREDADLRNRGLLPDLFKSGALLLAPLVHLDRIKGKQGTLICLPMKVKGTSGAPVRAIFIESLQ